MRNKQQTNVQIAVPVYYIYMEIKDTDRE